MKLLLDLTGLHDVETGVSTYIYELVEELVVINPDLCFTAILNPKFTRTDKLPSTIALFPSRIPHIGMKREIMYARLSKTLKKNWDLYHCLTEKWPLVMNGGVCTVHDARFLLSQGYSNGTVLKRLYMFLVTFQMRKCGKIIAVSRATKSALMNSPLRFCLPEIEVVQHGIRLNGLGATKKPKRVLSRSKYILNVAELKPHKNQVRMARAFLEVRKDPRFSDYKLIIAGNKSDESVLSELEELEDEGILTLGFVPREELNWLYENAGLFCFPSNFEGAGLPLLEALSFGVPVVCSGIPAFKEYGGGVVDYFDPQDTKSISQSIKAALSQGIDCDGRKMLKGHVAKFSWKSAAKKTYQIYLGLAN